MLVRTWLTFPIITESMACGSTFPDSIAALFAAVASSVTEKSFNFPPKVPKGVRFAATTKTPLQEAPAILAEMEI